MLAFPGGFVEFGETAEEALAREVHEELNLNISAPRYLTSVPNDYLYANVLYKTTDLYFQCALEDISCMRAQDDMGAVLLLRPEAIDPTQLAFSSARVALQRFLALHK